MKSTKQLKEELTQEPEVAQLPTKGALSSGSTMLNLACNGSPFSAFRRGGYYGVFGDSSAGKTVTASTCLAEAAINSKFDDYRLVFDNIEDGAMFFDKFYGERIARRIQAPRYKDRVPLNSRTVEELYLNIHRCCEEQPTVYVADSENALTSQGEIAKQEEVRQAIEKEKEITGIMTDHKAKIHSQNLRPALATLRDTQSIFILLGQTRDALGAMPGMETKTRSGGRALTFYAHLELWFSIVDRIRRTVKGKTRELGVIAEVHVKKNRFTGKRRKVRIPIYHSFGIDDLGSCVDYLIDEKHWDAPKGNLTAKEFDFQGTREDFVRHIESKNYERDLRALTGEVWRDTEALIESQVQRKSRYL